MKLRKKFLSYLFLFCSALSIFQSIKPVDDEMDENLVRVEFLDKRLVYKIISGQPFLEVPESFVNGDRSFIEKLDDREKFQEFLHENLSIISSHRPPLYVESVATLGAIAMKTHPVIALCAVIGGSLVLYLENQSQNKLEIEDTDFREPVPVNLSSEKRFDSSPTKFIDINPSTIIEELHEDGRTKYMIPISPEALHGDVVVFRLSANSEQQPVEDLRGKNSGKQKKQFFSGQIGSPMPGPPYKGPEKNGRKELKISEKDAKHIFRDKGGHFLKDTPENRKLIEDVANDLKNYLGPDKHGKLWYGKILKNGKQVWANVYKGKIRDAGLNASPQFYNPETGLSRLTRPGFKALLLAGFYQVDNEEPLIAESKDFADSEIDNNQNSNNQDNTTEISTEENNNDAENPIIMAGNDLVGNVAEVDLHNTETQENNISSIQTNTTDISIEENSGGDFTENTLEVGSTSTEDQEKEKISIVGMTKESIDNLEIETIGLDAEKQLTKPDPVDGILSNLSLKISLGGSHISQQRMKCAVAEYKKQRANAFAEDWANFSRAKGIYHSDLVTQYELWQYPEYLKFLKGHFYNAFKEKIIYFKKHPEEAEKTFRGKTDKIGGFETRRALDKFLKKWYFPDIISTPVGDAYGALSGNSGDDDALENYVHQQYSEIMEREHPFTLLLEGLTKESERKKFRFNESEFLRMLGEQVEKLNNLSQQELGSLNYVLQEAKQSRKLGSAGKQKISEFQSIVTDSLDRLRLEDRDLMQSNPEQWLNNTFGGKNKVSVTHDNFCKVLQENVVDVLQNQMGELTDREKERLFKVLDKAQKSFVLSDESKKQIQGANDQLRDLDKKIIQLKKEKAEYNNSVQNLDKELKKGRSFSQEVFMYNAEVSFVRARKGELSLSDLQTLSKYVSRLSMDNRINGRDEQQKLRDYASEVFKILRSEVAKQVEVGNYDSLTTQQKNIYASWKKDQEKLKQKKLDAAEKEVEKKETVERDSEKKTIEKDSEEKESEENNVEENEAEEKDVEEESVGKDAEENDTEEKGIAEENDTDTEEENNNTESEEEEKSEVVEESVVKQVGKIVGQIAWNVGVEALAQTGAVVGERVANRLLGNGDEIVPVDPFRDCRMPFDDGQIYDPIASQIASPFDQCRDPFSSARNPLERIDNSESSLMLDRLSSRRRQPTTSNSEKVSQRPKRKLEGLIFPNRTIEMNSDSTSKREITDNEKAKEKRSRQTGQTSSDSEKVSQRPKRKLEGLIFPNRTIEMNSDSTSKREITDNEKAKEKLSCQTGQTSSDSEKVSQKPKRKLEGLIFPNRTIKMNSDSTSKREITDNEKAEEKRYRQTGHTNSDSEKVSQRPKRKLKDLIFPNADPQKVRTIEMNSDSTSKRKITDDEKAKEKLSCQTGQTSSDSEKVSQRPKRKLKDLIFPNADPQKVRTIEMNSDSTSKREITDNEKAKEKRSRQTGRTSSDSEKVSQRPKRKLKDLIFPNADPQKVRTIEMNSDSTSKREITGDEKAKEKRSRQTGQTGSDSEKVSQRPKRKLKDLIFPNADPQKVRTIEMNSDSTSKREITDNEKAKEKLSCQTGQTSSELPGKKTEKEN